MPSLVDNQLSPSLSQQIQKLYQAYLGHQPGKVTCQSFEGKLAILLEDALTQPEQLLFSQGQIELVRQIRDCLHEILRPQVQSLIQEVMGVNVIDLLTATQLETGRVSFMVVLAPQANSSSSHPNSPKGLKPQVD
jgi:uncharacterized protein YbcI